MNRWMDKKKKFDIKEKHRIMKYTKCVSYQEGGSYATQKNNPFLNSRISASRTFSQYGICNP